MSGKVVLISGCSSGFGLITAVQAAKAGHRVFATMRDVGKRQEIDRAASAAKVTVDVRALDVDKAESIQTCVDGVLRDAGQIDVLVNNAGFGMGGTVYDLNMDELRAQFETNFFGTIALTKAVLPGMVARRQGRVIQVSSNNSRNAVPGLGAYSSSKAALDSLSEAMRFELASFGVFVTSVQPGMFKTDVHQKRRLAKAFGSASSPFRTISETGLRRVDLAVQRNAADPQPVAELLVRLIDDPAPPLRVTIGSSAKFQNLARSILPARTWEWLIRRAVGFSQA